jgi:mRNA (guanine-N7-)-methyltransferase
MAKGISQARIQEVQKREEERVQATQSTAPQASVSEFVTQHYNSVPERGREWRKTDSTIKGLRNYNNWVKSVLIIKHAPKQPGFNILDIGCGKGGDLGKWQHQKPKLYVGLDPADVSIQQASDRYNGMRRKNRRLFDAEFAVKDCFGSSLMSVPIVREVGFDQNLDARWGNGGFDIVSMMFCLHYAFESEEMARMMLKNVAGSLKKGGMFIGTIPNSDVLTAKVEEFYKKNAPAKPEPEKPASEDGDMPTFASDDDDDWDPEKTLDDSKPADQPAVNSTTVATEPPPSAPAPVPAGSTTPKTAPASSQKEEETVKLEFGNSIYKVKFYREPPLDGVFRPPFGWKYFYNLEEAVSAPEYVVPWEAFRALAEDYNLELEYRKEFREVWADEKDHREFGQLSERMGVKSRNGNLLISDDEMEACSFYHAFCFYKV